MSLKIKSTSMHHINGDKNLSFIEKLLWLFCNSINNVFPNSFLDGQLKIMPFSFDVQKHKRNILQNTEVSSPARTLSDIFWLELDWKEIKDAVGHINLLDIGCGSGRYGEVLLKEKNIHQYTGIDIYRHTNWDNLKNNPHMDFILFKGSSLVNIIPEETNVIISQSAFEHVENDYLFFKEIKKFIAEKKQPLVQIHIIPSHNCLFLYVPHGIRHYTFRKLSKITKLWNKHTRKTVYCLGGNKCKQLHWRAITRPRLFNKREMRESNPSLYKSELLSCIEWDIKNSVTKEGVFYVMELRHYC